ncbi:hydroxyacid dehydrogenase [Streptomyces sp. NPDC050610]|uniref:hydroxyacid dehydrogenase n=1 Tax=Streptomyces sp. NPDC050610 TaxID=3157097 RepID=UPI003440E29E
MRKPVVVVADPLDPETLKDLHLCEVRMCDGRDTVALHAALREADALLIRSGTRVDEAALAAAPRLRVVARAGVGLDNVDVVAATRHGVLVANAPLSNVLSVAELTIGLILALMRHVVPAGSALRAGRWERTRHQGIELAGRTVGIVGLGHVGTLVAQRLAAFKVEVIAYDPYVPQSHAQSVGAALTALDELMGRSDVVTVHLPKNSVTTGIIGERELRLAKPSMLLVNTARGGIVDETALAVALKEERLAGAALDVFEIEPAVGNPLLDLPNVLTTPHLGASTREAQGRAGREAVSAVLRVLVGERPEHAVNMAALDPGTTASRPTGPGLP